MKRMKKLFAILLCMVMVIGGLSGCKKTDKNSEPSTVPTQGEEAEVNFTEPVKYTYWLPATPNDYLSEYSKYPVVQYMNKKFNMTLEFQQPAAGTEVDALNLMIGTGEYTDIIDSAYYTNSIDELNKNGIIIDIAKYLDYMPNLKSLLDADPTFKKNVYNDNGQILKLPTYLAEDPLQWGGLVYRKDILDSMTGNKVTFPSGNDSPTTIADWEYMLPLYKQYFEASGMTDYAPFILPATGYFGSGDLLTGFGTAASYHAVDDKVSYGPIEEGFYNYLVKMNDWFQKGYIYKDFASRTNDLFYLPNTALTYGGAAGIWFGATSQLGTLLSQPDYGLNVDIQPILNPIDTEHGNTSAINMMYAGRNGQTGGAMISSTCQNVERLLTTIDYMYSEEGAMLKEYGLTKEQGAADDELYKEHGLTEGAYSIDSNGEVIAAEPFLPGGGLDLTPFVDYKMPGMRNNKYTNKNLKEIDKKATAIWLNYGYGMFPPIYRTTEEDATYTANQSNIEDYVNTMVLKFILGDEKLDKTSWEEYKKQIETFGVNDNIAIMQAAYDRYQQR